MAEKVEQQEEAQPRYKSLEEQEEALRTRYEGAVLVLEELTGVEAGYIKNAIAEQTGVIASGAARSGLERSVESVERWGELIAGTYGEQSLAAFKARVERAGANLTQYCGASGTLMSYDEAWEDLKDIWFHLLHLPESERGSIWTMIDGVVHYGTAQMVAAAVDKFYETFFNDKELAKKLAPWSHSSGLPTRRHALYKIETETTAPYRYLEATEHEGSVSTSLVDRLETGYLESVQVYVREDAEKDATIKSLKNIVARLEEEWDGRTIEVES